MIIFAVQNLENMNEETEALLGDLTHIDPFCPKEVDIIETKYNCSINYSVEKINTLQLTYYYEIDFNKDENLFVEIESGINNGTVLRSVGWGIDTKTNTQIVEVLTDIILDADFYEKGSFLERKSQAILTANKEKLFDFHRKNNYDNYVTGGNSKMKPDPLLNQLHLTYIFTEKEVDRNFI